MSAGWKMLDTQNNSLIIDLSGEEEDWDNRWTTRWLQPWGWSMSFFDARFVVFMAV